MNGQQLYLKPDEAKFLSMAVVALLEDLQAMADDPNINWTPDARKDIKDMLTAGNHLKLKLKKLGFPVYPLPQYLAGDEDEFLTKES